MNLVDYIIIFIIVILVLIVITVLANIFPKFILIIIIILFIASFIFNAQELINYSNESIKANSNTMISYCDLSNYKLFDYNIIIDNSDIYLTAIYLILFLLFWSNTIANIISNNNNFISEIKILGFNKYYNSDIYANYNYEYGFVVAIMIFIAYSLAIYIFNFIYYNFIGLNLKKVDVADNINKIKTTIAENISCDYLDFYIKESNKAIDTSMENIFTNYYLKVKENNQLYNNDEEFYLKCYITHYLYGLENRKKIVYENTNCNDSDVCIFKLLNGKDIYNVFPDKFRSLKYIEKKIYTDAGKDFSTYSDDIKNQYENFISTLQVSYNVIKTHERYNTIYYKLDLLFLKLLGMFFSLFAVIFFIKTEFKQLIKNTTGITIDPLEYTMEVYGTLIKFIIAFLSIIFVSVLFNS